MIDFLSYGLFDGNGCGWAKWVVKKYLSNNFIFLLFDQSFEVWRTSYMELRK